MNHEAFAKSVDDVRESLIADEIETAYEALHEQAQIVAADVRRDGPSAVTGAVMRTQTIVQEGYADIYRSIFPELAEILYLTYNTRSVKVSFPELLQRWLIAARDLVLSRPVQRRVKLVQQETIDKINEITAIGLENGLSFDRVADLIDGTEYGRPVEGRFPLVEPYTGPPVHDTTVRQRAQRIARTEGMSAANAGSRQGVIDTGLALHHFWIDILDKRTRDSHNTRIHPELAEPRPMDEPYVLDNKHGNVTLMFPSDPNALGDERAVAGETIECRCVEGYKVV